MDKISIGISDVLSNSRAPGSRVLIMQKFFEKAGFKVRLFSYKVIPPPSTKDKLEGRNFPNIFTNIYKSYNLAKNIVDYSYKENALIFSRGIYLGIFISLLSIRKNVKYGFDFHCKMESVLEWIFMGKYVRVLFIAPLLIFSIMKCDFVVGITPSICAYSNKMFGKRTFLIPNGIDSKNIKGIIDKNYEYKFLPRKEKYIFFIGHQEPWVPLEDMLEASVALQEYGFVVIGSSPLYKGYSLEYKNVLFLGELKHKDTINLAYNYADYFFHPFIKNDIWKYKSSRKLLEYLVLDKPIIVNTLRFLPKIIKESGMIFEYKYKDVSQLLNLLKSQEIKNNPNSNVDISDFSWEKFISNSGFTEYAKLM